MKIRALIVDDSAIYASLIKRALSGIDDVEVIGRAADGRDALGRVVADLPDLVTLDVEMPGMNGLEVLRAIHRQRVQTTVVMVSAPDSRARAWTIEALAHGAIDFITKPESGPPGENLAALRNRLIPLVAATAYRKQVRSLLRGSPESELAPFPSETPPRRPPVAVPETPTAPATAARSTMRPSMVLIGASTGGTEALTHIIPRLPAGLRVPVLIVQHMPPLFTQDLAESLATRSALRVSEAVHDETAVPGRVYIAPGGSHLGVAAGTRQEIRLRITSDPPENNCRPAVDYLFRSAAAAFPGRAVAVILTGMGRDGTAGMRRLKNSGCLSIVQNEATCSVFGMPKEAILAGVVDIVAPLDSIATEIVRAVR